MERNPQRKAIRMFSIWMLSIVPVYIYSGLRWYAADAVPENYDMFTILLLALMGIYYFPMMLRVYRLAKRSEINWLVACSKVLLFLMGGVLILSPIALLFSFMAQ